jgi:hypothetical protein
MLCSGANVVVWFPAVSVYQQKNFKRQPHSQVKYNFRVRGEEGASDYSCDDFHLRNYFPINLLV